MCMRDYRIVSLDGGVSWRSTVLEGVVGVLSETAVGRVARGPVLTGVTVTSTFPRQLATNHTALIAGSAVFPPPR